MNENQEQIRIEAIRLGGALHHRCSEVLDGRDEYKAIKKLDVVQGCRPLSSSSRLCRYDDSDDYAWFTANSSGGWTSHDPVFRMTRDAS